MSEIVIAKVRGCNRYDIWVLAAAEVNARSIAEGLASGQITVTERSLGDPTVCLERLDSGDRRRIVGTKAICIDGGWWRTVVIIPLEGDESVVINDDMTLENENSRWHALFQQYSCELLKDNARRMGETVYDEETVSEDGKTYKYLTVTVGA